MSSSIPRELGSYVVPRKVRFDNALPHGLPGKAQLVTINSTNGSTYSPTGTNQIQFYLNSDGMLDSDHTSFVFGVKNTSGTTARLSSSCNSVIRRFRVYGPSNQVLVDSDYDNYLMALLGDVQVTQDFADTTGNMLMGMAKRSGKTPALDGNAAAAAPLVFSNCQDMPTIADDSTAYFEMNLGHLFNNDKYIPLRSINSPGLLVLIDLELPTVALRGAPVSATGVSTYNLPAARSALDYEIISPQIHAQIVRFGESYTQFYDSLVAAGGVQLHFDRFTLYRRVMTSDALTTEVLNHRSRSIKSIIGMVQRNYFNGIERASEAAANNNAGEILESRVDRNAPADLTRTYPTGFQVQLRSGNNVIPQNALSQPIELYRELLHSLGDSGMSGQAGTRIDRNAYTFNSDDYDFVPASETSDEQVCKFAWGIDLEAYQDKIQSGYSTMNGEHLEVIMSGTLGSAGGVNFMWVLDDCVVSIDPLGNVSASY